MGARSRAALVPPADPERLREAESVAARAGKPAVWQNVRVATAGWADRSLVSSSTFYPENAKTPEGRLRHYASQFSLVEVDATYYALLGADLVARWVDWTPAHFRFDVKAHPVFTGHPIETERLPRDLKLACSEAGVEPRVYPERLPREIRNEIEARFAASLEPLRAGGRLGAVLVQFPPWFQATRGNVRAIEAVAGRLRDVGVCVEFRHKSWLLPERRERVFDLLRDLGLAYVCVDEPPSSRIGGLPPAIAVTSPRLAVVRFHGRNMAGWERRGASVEERFNYLYRPEELAAWVGRIRALASKAGEVHAVFNNCVRNYAVLNAKDLAVLLAETSDAALEPERAIPEG